MRYLGGKHWIAGPLAKAVAPYREGRRLLEPFCGGLSITVALQPEEAADASRPLIELIMAVRAGFDPPTEISENLYDEVKTAGPDHPLYNFVGLCATWGGKWWGGYARGHKRQINPAGAARTALLRKVSETKSVNFTCRSYEETPFRPGDVLYCDPPYAGTTEGYATPPFYSPDFWDWCRWASSCGAVVLVSEFNAPEDMETVAIFPRKTNVRKGVSGGEVLDKLFLVS
jgi:DNA adenine methylase